MIDENICKRFGKIFILQESENYPDSYLGQYDCGNLVTIPKACVKEGQCTGCLESRGEICAAERLNSLGIRCIPQYKIGEDLTVDFYLPDYNIGIDCDVTQHFFAENNLWKSKTKLLEARLRDMKTEEACEELGIRFIRIPFWAHDKLSAEYLGGLVK